MKISFILLCCFTFVFGILAGCTGINTTESISETSRVSSPANGIEPVLGSWTNKTDYASDNVSVTFSKTGTIILSKNQTKTDIGDWIKDRDNAYIGYIIDNNKTFKYIFIYNKSTDTLRDSRNFMYYRITETPITAGKTD
ncbi:MAG TPA: hypothetical protein VJ350_05305 [Methanoregula sp.]|nr:hypothetical protein [Methanoregula sp.]